MTLSTMDKEQSHLSAQRLMPGLALSALISTILLIGMGSIVRVTGHGLGCPDWPLCYGHVIPPSLTGAWVEFTHRLFGAAASVQIVILGVLAWRYHRGRPWVFWPAVVAVGLLVVQVSLGGLHVILEIPPATGWVHTGVAMLIVGLLAVQVANTWPAMQSLQETVRQTFPGNRLRTWVSGTAVATYLLVLTGSYVTRKGASLACPSFPGCGAAGRTSFTEIQMLHRYTAFGVAFLTLVTVVWLLTKQNDRLLRGIAYGLAVLLLVQFGLGIANVLLSLPMWSRVLHLIVAASLWAGMVLLWSLCVRRHNNTRSPSRSTT